MSGVGKTSARRPQSRRAAIRGCGGKRSVNPQCPSCRPDDEKIVVAAGTFDILHPGHLHYLAHAKALGRLVVIVSSDEQAEKSGKQLVHTQQERAELVRALRIVDEVVLGGSDSPLRTIEKIKPGIIYLGYDQKMPEEVLAYCKRHNVVVLRDSCASEPWRHKTTKIKERIRRR
ncbi:MAG: FAD synthase [Candidatus Micrarchaeota archaeon]|nr:FAD synthase [Candidatus Micrarchaeota archaeon]